MHLPSSITNFFCENNACADYRKSIEGNIRKFGKTQKGVQRFQCKTCRKTFIATLGTVFHRKRHTAETILECFALVAEKKSLASLHRIKGIKEETISDWLDQAATQVEEIEKILLSKYPFEPTQLKFLWECVEKKRKKTAKK